MAVRKLEGAETPADGFDVHVVMVSDQAAANFMPATEPGFAPKKVVMLVSAKMTPQAGHLEKALRSVVPGMKVETVPVADPYDIQGMLEQFFKVFFRLSEEEGRIALNVTGGTKPMAIAALKAAETCGVTCFYQRVDTNTVVFLEKGAEERKLVEPRRLRTYLMAYGYEYAARPGETFLRACGDVIDGLVRKKSYGDSLSALNALAAQAKGSLRARAENASPALNALLDEFERAALLEFRGRDVVFKNEEARFFVNGGWLEEFTAAEAHKAFPGAEVVRNAEVIFNEEKHSPKQEIKNEIDVMFWENDHLCLVECKTCSMTEGHYSDILSKFSAVSSHFGLKVRRILISYYPLTDRHRKRAETEKICVISGDDLKRLGERLKHFVRHGYKNA